MKPEQIDAKLAEHAEAGDRNAATLLAIRQGKLAIKSDRMADWLRRTGQAK